MIINSNIFITSDLEVINNLFNTHKVVILGETMPSCLPKEYVIPATILLPPYEALEAEMDDDLEKYVFLYLKHLQSKEASEFIAILLYAILNGTNIMFYISKDELELNYCNFFLNYLLVTFGISVGTRTSEFSYQNDPIYDRAILNLLYINDLIKFDQFLTMYPIDFSLEPIILHKLVNEINPYIENMDFHSYHDYFTKYIKSVKSYGYLIEPISKG